MITPPTYPFWSCTPTTVLRGWTTPPSASLAENHCSAGPTTSIMSRMVTSSRTFSAAMNSGVAAAIMSDQDEMSPGTNQLFAVRKLLAIKISIFLVHDKFEFRSSCHIWVSHFCLIATTPLRRRNYLDRVD